MTYLYFSKRTNSPAREAFFSLRGPVITHTNRAGGARCERHVVASIVYKASIYYVIK